MAIEIFVSCDGNWERPEVQIFGGASEMTNFGKVLLHLEAETYLHLNNSECEHYPFSIGNLAIKLKNVDANNLLNPTLSFSTDTI